MGNKSVVTSLFDYIKEKEEEREALRKKRLFATGIDELDNLNFLEKGQVTIVYTNQLNIHITNITNDLIYKMLKKQKSVLQVSSFLSEEINKIMRIIENDNGDLESLPLYVFEYLEEENAFEVLESIEQNLSSFKVDIIYFPGFQYFIYNLDYKKQAEILNLLESIAEKNNVTVFLTLSAFDLSRYDACVNKMIFGTQKKINEAAILNVTNINSIFYLKESKNNEVILECSDFMDDSYKQITLKSNNGFLSTDIIDSGICDLENTIPF